MRTRRAREAGLSSLEFVGIALVAGTVISGITIAVAPEPITATMRYAVCTITGGDCAPPLGVPAPRTSEREQCSPAASGPLGGTRATFRVSIGGGETVLVEATGGGAYRVVAPSGTTPVPGWPTPGAATSRIDALGTSPSATIYSAGSLEEVGDVLGGLGRQRVHEQYFGTGGNPAAEVWSDAGDVILDGVGMSQRAPSAPSTFTAADLAEQPSSYAYDLALSLGEGGRDVAPLGTAHRPDGTTTQYLLANVPLSGGAATQYVVELERDAKGYLTTLRTTSGTEELSVDADGSLSAQGAPGTYVTSLRVETPAQVAVAENVLTSLGINQTVAFPTPAGATPSAAPPGDVAASLSAFRGAAVAGGTVTRQPSSAPASGQVLEPDALPQAVAEASKTTPGGEQWNGTSWQPWSGCA